MSWSHRLLFFCVIIIKVINVSCSSVYQMTTELIDKQLLNNGIYVVKDDIDLDGKTIGFPEGCTLVLDSGSLHNGTIVGNNTMLKYSEHCLDMVDIKGTWIVPVIKSSMFVSQDFNSLRSLFNLQNDSIHNDIIIEAGEYHINANGQRAAFLLRSNSHLQLDGILIMDPQINDEFNNGYYAIYIYGAKNVVIDGSGKILGDLGRSGIRSEYGHGICVFASEKVSISGIEIADVQGDGVVVSKNNKNVILKNLTIDNYHRNGISIIDGENIQVEEIRIKNGGGTEPFAAIDIEPNEGDSIYNVSVKNLYIRNCGVGIAGFVPPNAVADKIHYDGINMSGITRCCMNSANFRNLIIDKVLIEDCSEDVQIMRFIGNENLVFNQVSVNTPNCKAKYPFYINSVETTFNECSFCCPQLFSFHLSNAHFENTHFDFDSFLWTAANLTNKNLSFISCEFDGPLFIRPDNVLFENCLFKNNKASKQYLVCFEEATGNSSEECSVVLKNNTFQLERNITKETAIKNSVRNSRITKARFEKR